MLLKKNKERKILTVLIKKISFKFFSKNNDKKIISYVKKKINLCLFHF